ncbi:MAG: hypothetical protein RR978_06860 [Oscillospiraceae bacterium]
MINPRTGAHTNMYSGFKKCRHCNFINKIVEPIQGFEWDKQE